MGRQRGQEHGKQQVGPAALAIYVDLEFVAQATELLRKGHRLTGRGQASHQHGLLRLSSLPY
jgi:hypothetical protein